jgi:hypothetical protein
MSEQFTDTEALLAADRFLIAKQTDGFRLSLATNFMATGRFLSNIRDCVLLVDESMARGHKVFIRKQPHGSSRVPPTPSA